MPVGTLRILAQVRGQSTIASAYSPAAGARARIFTILVANTSGSSIDFQICIDDDGTTYTAATAIAWNVPLNDGEIKTFDLGDRGIPLNEAAGNIAVMSATNDAHTFTIIGEEIQ